MAARKINLKDQLGRVVRVPTATAAPAPTTPPVTQPETARPVASVWKLIREIPANIQKLAKLVGTGFTTRGADGEWYQRSIAQGEGIAATNGDGVAGNPIVGLAVFPTPAAAPCRRLYATATGVWPAQAMRLRRICPRALTSTSPTTEQQRLHR